MLLAGKAHVKDDKVQADSSLLLAADHGHLEVVKLLVAAGADVNHQTGFEPDFIGGMDRKHNGMQTPLLVAASGGHVETVEALLKWKANPNVRDQFGLSPLDHAARIGSLPIAELLIAHKARIAWPAADEPRRYPLLEFHRPIGFPGTTTLHWAAEGGHDKVVALLLENGADPHSLDVHKRTPLHRLLDDVDYSYVAGLRFVTLGMQQIIEPKN
ncbi:MAG: ankyrin repeat domain-containing protein, partial [bacterium]|nr:ankyrin repeat domain-containing protein [bacterium]